LVIRGHISEVETVVRQAIVAIEQTEAEFKHFLAQFPNNRHTARSYLTFLADITADPLRTREFQHKIAKLSRGIRVHPDQAHTMACALFPALPECVKSTQTVETAASSGAELSDDQLESVDDQKLTIPDCIEMISVPAVLGARLAVISCFVFVELAPLAALLVWASAFLTSVKTEVHCIGPLTEMRMFSLQLPAFSFRAIGEHLHIWGASPPGPEPPANLGRTWVTHRQLSNLAAMCVNAVQQSSALWLPGRESDRLHQAQQIFFGSTTSYPYCHSPTEWECVTTAISGVFTMIMLARHYGPSVLETTPVLNAYCEGMARLFRQAQMR
jgi:hypothetical protein